jgi:predicted trehalose synthase
LAERLASAGENPNLVHLPADRVRELVLGKRWFGPASRTINDVRVIDAASFDPSGVGLVLAIVEISTTDRGPELFHLPLVRDEKGALEDVAMRPAALDALSTACAEHRRIEGARGAFLCRGRGWPETARSGARTLGLDQSNTSFVLGEEIILKLFRRVNVGHNPDVEVGRWLAEAKFAGAPRYVADVSYVGEQVANIDVAIANVFERHAIDAWSDIVARVRSWLEGAHAATLHPSTRPIDDTLYELGVLTAELHEALGRNVDDRDFSPEPLYFDALRPALTRVQDGLDGLAKAGVLTMPHTARWLAGLEGAFSPGLGDRIRIHGDFHLGQLLVTPTGLRIVDFEGEPTRPLDERRQKHSPLKDVAGMLRSFGYAAHQALSLSFEPSHPLYQEKEALAHRWELRAREQYVLAYRARMHAAPFRLPGREKFDAVLSLYELEKALYELDYETRYRPTWVDVPKSGLARFERRFEGAAE